MPGPLPLPIEHSASTYGEETSIRKSIESAFQYNPASKLGITAGDQPSKAATDTLPSVTKAVAPTLPELKSGLESDANVEIPQVPPYVGPHPFTSSGLAEHRMHLGNLTNKSTELQAYLSG